MNVKWFIIFVCLISSFRIQGGQAYELDKILLDDIKAMEQVSAHEISEHDGLHVLEATINNFVRTYEEISPHY